MTSRLLIPEWQQQESLLITWPHRHSDWRDVLDAVEPVYVAMADAISRTQKLLILVFDSEHEQHVAQRISHCRLDNIQTLRIATNDTWIRDYGPLSVWCDGQWIYQDWIFNGWGGKFEAGLDNAVNARLADMGVLPRAAVETMDMVLEGGSIESNGAGLLLTTYTCLIEHNRNPDLSQKQIEARLKKYLGAENVIWLRHGWLEGDDTDGHVDTLARFTDAKTIAYCSCVDPNDPHFAALSAMEQELRDAASRFELHLVPLPLPEPCLDAHGKRLPATYANFVITNDSVLAPIYGVASDRTALNQMRACFPEREIIAIPSRALIAQGGSLHCASMQLPKRSV